MAREHYETLQQVFDDAYTGLAAQGFEASTGADGFCAYRGDGGRSCAIGHCLPSDLYSDSFEGQGILYVRGKLYGLFGHDIRTSDLMEIQRAHDLRALQGLPMASELKRYANERGLTIPDISSDS